MRLVPPVLSVLVAAGPVLAQAQKPTRPDAYLGRALGADFQLPDWKEVRGYFEQLDRESGRVVLQKVGATTEGRDFVLAVISSEENLGRIEALKGFAATCSDPRGKTREQQAAALEKGRPFVFISCAMHATECAAPQFAMQLAWELATSEQEPWPAVRENCVVLLAPSLNPDGLDHVVEWYRKTVNTPYESSELPELYQRYCGHDNNRDWFMLTQQETRLVTQLLYETWKPQVYWDVHQQGSKAERLFVPPFRDPLDPNIDPAMVCGMNLLGTRAQADLTREGRAGVATGGTFDMWWNGGNRNVPVRHNIVGLLTEAASCRLASPIFVGRDELRSPTGAKEYAPSNAFPLPWPGGWWRVADIVVYELSFARSLLGSLAREPRYWLANQMQAAERAVRGDVPGAPEAWIVPSSNADLGATLRLADVLLAGGIEIQSVQQPFVCDGRSWPAGSLFISAHQPYMRHVKDLFDTQSYPAGDPPYDVAGWTLPALLGVEAAELRADPQATKELALERVKSVDDARKALSQGRAADGAQVSLRDSESWKNIFARLARSGRVEVGDLVLEKLPRIALYSPWSGNIDEGWTRWVFDSFGIPFTTVRNEALRAGSLRELFDVLVLSGVGAGELDKGRAPGTVFDELAGGLEPEGAIAIEEFVRSGGTLVAAGGSCAWAIELFKLPVLDVTVGADAKDFSCPGSVLRTIPEPDPFTVGLSESVAVFGASPKAFRVAGDKDATKNIDVLLRYAPTRTLISGYLAKPELIAGQGAWLRARHGTGHVHLFGFRPQYRGWSQAAFQLLFRALLFDARAR